MTSLGTFVLGLTTLPVALGIAWLCALLWQALRTVLDRCRRGHFLSHPVEDGETVGAVWVCENCGRERVVTIEDGIALLGALDAAEAERDEWRQTALDERGAALDALEQVKVRDGRIQAVQHLIDQADHAGNWTVTCTHLQWAIDG